MDARTGKKIRLGRLFGNADGKALIVAYSHGVLMGPRPGMRTLDEMRRLAHAVRRADGLMVAPGLLPALEDAFVGRERPSLVLHFDYQSFSRAVLPYREGASVALATVEEALAAGADALMTYLYLGFDDPEREKMEIARNAQVARACERWGMGLIIEPRSAREAAHPDDKSDPAVMAMYCRISAEIGGDLIKCIWPGRAEAFAQIVQGCPAPVLVAGGAKAREPAAAHDVARQALEVGAAGIIFGRNIYEAADPEVELGHYRQIVHAGQPAGGSVD